MGYLSEILDQKQGEYVLTEKLFSDVCWKCNKEKLVSEHTTQISFTKYIAKLYATERTSIGG